MERNKKKIEKKIPHQSTQSNINIADIYKGVVITKDYHFIKILEVSHIPFTLYSRKEQYNVAKKFENVLLQCTENVQLTAITLPADLSYQKNRLMECVKDEKYISLKRMANEYKDVLVNHENTSLQRRFFISFEYVRDLTTREIPTIDVICDNLNDKATRIESALLQCGNKVLHHISNELNYETERNESVEEILYQILNRNSEDSYRNHKNEILSRYQEYMNEHQMNKNDVFIPPTEYLAPFSLDFRSKNYVVVNNSTYYTYAYIPSNGYNTYVDPGWLTPFINIISGVDINIYLQRDDSELRRHFIRQSIKDSKSSLYSSREDSAGIENAEDALYAGRYLNEGLRNRQKFYNAAIMFTISGDSPNEVESKYELLQRMCRQPRIKLARYTYQQEQAYYSALPFGKMDKGLFKYAQRNMLDEGASSLYPFTTSEFSDPNGVLLGVDESSLSPVIVNFWNNQMFTNMNIGIFGTSGCGKTVTILTLATRLRMMQVPIIILACEKEHEYKRVTEAVGGQFISIATGSNDRINIMEILPRDESVDEETFGDTGNRSYLEAKVDSLIKWIRLKTGRMTPEEETSLNIAIHNTYSNAPYYITADNESLIDPLDEEHKRFKKMPILEDLYHELKKDTKTLRLAQVLSYFIYGSGKSFNGQTNVDLTNKFIVFGLEGMSDNDFPLGMYLAMDYVWAKIKEDASAYKALYIDEFWKVCQSPESASLADEMIRLVRAYSASMVVATQSFDDVMKFDGGLVGRTILDNTSTKILLKMTEDKAMMVGDLLHLTQEQITRIHQQDKGHCLLSAGNTYIKLSIINGIIEKYLFYTDSETKKQWKEHKDEIEDLLFKEDIEENEKIDSYSNLNTKSLISQPYKSSTINHAINANSALARLLVSDKQNSSVVEPDKSNIQQIYSIKDLVKLSEQKKVGNTEQVKKTKDIPLFKDRDGNIIQLKRVE